MKPEFATVPGERVEVLEGRRRLADVAFTIDELAGSPAPSRPWHSRPLIPGRAVTLQQGDGGSGKSTLGLQLAVSTVTGRPWLGHSVRRGNVLYLSAEDDRDEIHRRLEAIAEDYGVGLDQLTGLKVIDVTGEDAVLAAADSRGRLAPTDRWDELEAQVRAWEPVLVIIDNLADVFGGEENSRPHARQFVSLLQGCAKRQDASIVLIGHPSLAGMSSGSGTSGSTAWSNSVRSRLYLTRPDGEASGDTRILAVKKSNYGPANLEIQLRWRAGVFIAEGGGAQSGLEMQAAEARIERAFLDLLASYEAQGRTVSHQPGPTYAPSVFARDPAAQGAKKDGLARAMNRLFKAGEIEVVTTGPASRRRSHLARVKTGEAE